MNKSSREKIIYKSLRKYRDFELGEDADHIEFPMTYSQLEQIAKNIIKLTNREIIIRRYYGK